MAKLTALAATLGSVLALVGPGTPAAQAASADRQTASYTFTTPTPGAPTGFSFSIDFKDPANPGGKPYSVAEWIIRLPAGTVLDDTTVPQCTASDAELTAQGASACPAASRIGGGTLITDAGGPGGAPNYTENAVTQFNAKGQIIGYAETTSPPTRAVSRTTVDGDTLTSPIPTLPGYPQPDPYLAFRTVRLSGPAIVNGAHAAGRTPPSCPAVGYWTTSLTFVYHDGVSQTVESRSPCQANATPTIPVARTPLIPRACRGARHLTYIVRLRKHETITTVHARGPRRRLPVQTHGRHLTITLPHPTTRPTRLRITITLSSRRHLRWQRRIQACRATH